MSLKEEISRLLVFETFDDYTKANLFTTQIIKKIEKRIDEMMHKYSPIESSYQTGYYNATCDFKDMLK